MKLKRYKLGEIGKIVTGKTPRTAIIENYGGDVPFLTPTDDLSAQYVERTNKTLSPKGINEVKNCLLPPNTICVSCIGSNLGEVVITKEPTVTNQQFNSIIIHPQFDAQYIYYVLTLQKKQLQIIGNSATAVPIINKTTFENYEVVIHDNIADQRRIASVLSNLDRKIALNRQINTNLEALARQLYDYWFVQFDFPDANGNPYKSSGGKMTYNEKLKRHIPDEWEVCDMKSVLEIKSGFPFKSSTYLLQGKYRIITIKNVQDGFLVIDDTDFINELPQRIPNYCILQKGDILISLTGNVGRVGRVFADNLLLNQRVGYVDCRYGYKNWAYLYMTNSHVRQQIEKLGIGSAQSNVSPIQIGAIIMVLPPKNLMEIFDNKVASILNLIIANQAEIASLTRQRDELLPLLMNGQVTVEEV